jgi:hypothetical protein
MVLRHRVGWDAGFMQRSAWFWPLRAAAARFREYTHWPGRADFDANYAALAVARGAEPLRFGAPVLKQDKRDGAGQIALERHYDGRIALAANVPTRDCDWHDFFNALCFTTFPRAKRALHRRQYDIARARLPAGAERLPGARTPEQDALTLFDEGGAVLAAALDASQKLRAADEAALPGLVAQQVANGVARVVPFGHALFEHLVEGLRCPGGSTHIVTVGAVGAPDDALLDQVDVELARMLGDPERFRAPRAAAHLRLDALGLPGRAQ